MDLSTPFLQLGISLGLGLLVGLQRERVESRVAGFRTFALIAVFGTVCGQLAGAAGAWIIVAGLLAVAGLIASANILKGEIGREARESDPGQTTEVAMLLMFGIGAYLTVGPLEVAIAMGGGLAVLLHLKPELHRLAGRIGDQDFRAIMQFALISLVILPALPDRPYGPYEVLNPHEVWLMVVLVVGIGLAGYVAYKLLGERTGTLVAGLLGGVISSTATTVSYARRSREAPETGPGAALVIVLASGVVLVRVLIEIAVVAPALLRAAAGPAGALLALFALLAAALWLLSRRQDEPMPEQENPSQLKPALVFGLLYAAVLLTVAFARHRFGSQGLYAVAALSGLTDVDAITLSTGQLVHAGRLPAGQGWRVILVAVLSNLVFKGGTVAVLGSRGLLGRIALCYAVAVAAGASILLFWP